MNFNYDSKIKLLTFSEEEIEKIYNSFHYLESIPYFTGPTKKDML